MSRNLLSGDSGTHRIYHHSGATGTILNSFFAPQVMGLTWDGTNLLSCDLGTGKVYHHVGASAWISNSFASPGSHLSGLAWDGANLISCDWVTDRIQRHSGATATILNSFASPQVTPMGLTWGGGNLFSLDFGVGTIYRHSGATSTILNTFATPGGGGQGLAWDGANLLSCDADTDRIYRHAGATGTVSFSFVAPGGDVSALTWGGAPPPTISTQMPTGIAATSATGHGTILNEFGVNVTRRGFCYFAGTTGHPSIADSVVFQDGSFNPGAYSLLISGLQHATSYRVSAYCTNNSGTGYGGTFTFTTAALPPTVSTQAPISIRATSATGRGTLIDERGANVFRRGFCYFAGTTGNPTVADSVVFQDGNFNPGVYAQGISGLQHATSYRVRAYCTNSIGVGYGTTFTFTTDALAPTVSTQNPTNILPTSVTGRGTLIDERGDNVTRRGFCYFAGTTGNPTVADSVVFQDGSFNPGAYSLSISGLQHATSYRVRAYCTNGIGTGYGLTVTVSTAASVPTLSTQAPTNILPTSVQGRGTLLGEEGANVTRRGFCYFAGTTGNPTTANSVVFEDGSFNPGAYSLLISGLAPLTSYRVRAYAINAAGTGYGLTVTVATAPGFPTLSTQLATAASSLTFQANGTLLSQGEGGGVTRRGFCYMPGTTGTPTIANSIVFEDGSFPTGSYSLNVTGLIPNTAYRVRAYATNPHGTGYGGVIQARTAPAAPVSVVASDGTFHDRVRVDWGAAAGATGYQVYRDGIGLGVLGPVTSFDDLNATPGAITPGNAAASDGTFVGYVELVATGAIASPGVVHVYTVRAMSSWGESLPSVGNAGHKGPPPLTFQWQRSLDDSDANYTDIPGAITQLFHDTGAPG